MCDYRLKSGSGGYQWIEGDGLGVGLLLDILRLRWGDWGIDSVWDCVHWALGLLGSGGIGLLGDFHWVLGDSLSASAFWTLRRYSVLLT